MQDDIDSMGSMGLSKAALRAGMKRRRAALAPEERRERSRAAAEHILASAAWKQAEHVALYMAVRGECDSSLLLAGAFAEGKKVLLPLCSETEAGSMEFVPCTGVDALVPGPFGILQPMAQDPAAPPPCAPDIIVVPGLAFDTRGVRLGMGGGYYDRLLARPRYAGSVRLGFAYAFQVLDSLPREAWDLPVHAVCTEAGIVRTQQALRE